MFLMHLSPVAAAIAGALALKTFNAAVKALSRPDEHSSPFYRWFFNFTNSEAADLEAIFAARFRVTTGAEGSAAQEGK